MSVASHASQPISSQLSLSQLATEPASQVTVQGSPVSPQLTLQLESPSQPTWQPPPPQSTEHSDAPSQSIAQPPPSQSYAATAAKSASSAHSPSGHLAVQRAPRHSTEHDPSHAKSHICSGSHL